MKQEIFVFMKMESKTICLVSHVMKPYIFLVIMSLVQKWTWQIYSLSIYIPKTSLKYSCVFSVGVYNQFRVQMYTKLLTLSCREVYKSTTSFSTFKSHMNKKNTFYVSLFNQMINMGCSGYLVKLWILKGVFLISMSLRKLKNRWSIYQPPAWTG